MISRVLMITTAYEQGVGKGHQASRRATEITNPYADSECSEAWALGYKEGKGQAARILRAEPVAVAESDFQLVCAQHNWSENLKVGDKLYASLQPAQQPTIPPGYKLVPVEPTREMLTAWIKADVVSNRTAPDLYRAMLAAAPEGPATNLNCKSTQKRLATMWGFVPAQQPLADEKIGSIGRTCEKFANNGSEWFDRWAFARAIERAHNIK